MNRIKIDGFSLLFALLLFFGGVILTAACTKQPTAIVDSRIPSNTDSMPHTGSKKYLALGDSYTIGTSIQEADRYPVQTAAILKSEGIDMANAEIIATNGWTTGDLINATKGRPVSTDYSAVSLLIGVNNQYQGKSLTAYKDEFTTLIKRSIELANGKPDHVFVLSIPDYSVTPFASSSNRAQIAKEIDDFNTANKLIASDFKVNYLYITDESRKAAGDPSLVASDGLHFSGKEYMVWSLLLARLMKPFLQ